MQPPAQHFHVSLPLLTLTAALAFLAPGTALAQVDDFNDGNDLGWTRYQPLAPFGAPGTFSFPAGGYRIEAAVSPNPGALGPGRAAGYRGDVSYTDFLMSFDLVNWDNTLNQSFGGLARLSQIGLGTTDGYFLTYNVGGSFTIGRVNNEAPTSLGSMALLLSPTDDYRIVFSGVGSALTGQIFNLSDLNTPLASLAATDGAFASGFNGLLAFDNTPTGSGRADVTFDNFLAVVPEPSSTGFVLLGVAALCYAAFRRKK